MKHFELIRPPHRSAFVTLFLKLLPCAIWPSSPPLPLDEAGAGAATAAAVGAAGAAGALAGGGGGGMSACGGGGGGTDSVADDRTGEVGTDDTDPARVLGVERLALLLAKEKRDGTLP